jgi:hypothetical protein
MLEVIGRLLLQDPTVMPIDIECLHGKFRSELAIASHAFYLWKTIHNVASGEKSIHRGLNEQALAWNVITHSLQTTFFIALGRLFDTDADSFSAHSYLRACIANLDQFGRDALRSRKIRLSDGQEPAWLAGYIASAYAPSERDFQMLRGELSKRQRRYEEIYRPIRNQVFAHKDASALDNVDSLFGKTNIGEIQDLILFLYQVQEVVGQFLSNGRLTKMSDFTFSDDRYVSDSARCLLGRLRMEAKA